MKNNKKKSKATIEDELEGIENIGRLHDGENTFIAETIVFTGSDDSGAAGALSCLTIKDIEGRKFTVALPNGFVEKLTQNGVHHIFNKQPVEKSKKKLEKFKKDFRLYFDHEASDEFIEEIYYSGDFPICFIVSNLYIKNLKDTFDLSADHFF